jgi:FkbM family methyltransferase
MTWMTGRMAFRLRGYARALGIPKLVARFRPGYEEAYSEQLKTAIRPSDIVWDVGANVGHYTTRISEWVGASGKVFAFEPDQVTQERLRANCAGRSNIVVLGFGLSDSTSRARLLAGTDSLRATSRLIPAEAKGDGVLEAQLVAGDETILKGQAEVPNVVKVDVEGHELSVLKGLRNALADPRLRSILVEVHFGILDSMGRADDARQIEALLAENRFEIAWIDPSHLHARRRTPS